MSPMSVSLKVTTLIFIFLPACHGTLLLRSQGLSAFWVFFFLCLLTKHLKDRLQRLAAVGRMELLLPPRYLWDVTKGRSGNRVWRLAAAGEEYLSRAGCHLLLHFSVLCLIPLLLSSQPLAVKRREKGAAP